MIATCSNVQDIELGQSPEGSDHRSQSWEEIFSSCNENENSNTTSQGFNAHI